ncbi:MAG: hypothetical protein ACYCV4_16270 [Dermatophilaceae bacterium]
MGHVQRGGAPSAFDRCLATLLGHAAWPPCSDTRRSNGCSPNRPAQHRN